MNPIQIQYFQKAVEHHKAGEYAQAELIYNALLNGVPHDTNVAQCLAELYLQKRWHGLAIHLLTNLLRAEPNRSEAWCDLGVAYRCENMNDYAKLAWERALAIKGDTTAVCNNMAGLYADTGSPQEALAWAERALKCDPQDPSVLWNKSLALLTLRQFEEGWKLYEHRTHKETWHERKSVEAPRWDGKPVDSLYIHGEQGVGDEIMFASAIPHVLSLAKHITLEVNAKVAGIAKQTWPQFAVIKEETAGRYDAKVPIGSLIGMFGVNTKPFLNPHPEKIAFYRRELEKLGPGPYIAVAWLGGTKETRVLSRCVTLKDLEPILSRYTCVSAQYTHPETKPDVEKDRIAAGLKKINDESCGEDLHDQAALFKAVDAVVTVQQTAVHVAGGVGAKTFALIGKNPHWRYGVEGDSMPFYSSVRLFRKQTEWPEVVERILGALHRELPSTQRQAA